MSQAENIHQLPIKSAVAEQKNGRTFSIIDGEYDMEMAQLLAVDLMQANLQSHILLGLREYESMNGSSNELSLHKKRLEQYKSEAIELLKSAGKDGKKVKIEAEIRVSII